MSKGLLFSGHSVLITKRMWHTPCPIRWKSLTLDDLKITDSTVGYLATAGLLINPERRWTLTVR